MGQAELRMLKILRTSPLRGSRKLAPLAGLVQAQEPRLGVTEPAPPVEPAGQTR